MKYPKINKVKKISIRGPWETKSGGLLKVLTVLSMEDIDVFLNDESRIVEKEPSVQRGLRVYGQEGINAGKIGGGEFHHMRDEHIFVTNGEIRWTLEDVFGGKVVYDLRSDTHGIWVPPGILHTYESMSDNSSLLVIANTLFDPNDPTTHDTYNKSQFGNNLDQIT